MKRTLIFIWAPFLMSNTLDARNCFPSVDDDLSISGDCDVISVDCANGNSKTSTFISPRPITADLTYRNCTTFFNRFHGDASCYFFTYDSTFIVQQTRKNVNIGRGFFGQNPLLVAQFGAPFNSTNLGLVSSQPEGFFSTIRLSPRRKVFAWMPQFIFNLEGLCDCLWADIVFAVVQAKHQINIFEQIITVADDEDRTTVKKALDQLQIFPESQSHTGVDDVEMRVGYTVQYCEDDMFGFYAFGSIPTRRKFDNSRWFQPLVGSKSVSIGAGLIFDSTLWYSEFVEAECLLLTELKYRYQFSYSDRRIFDLNNGPLSRFLLVAPQDNPNKSQSGTTLFRGCVTIEPCSSVDWWIALHYKYCCWGLEIGYNLWFLEHGHIRPTTFDFESFGIFDMTRTINRTSHSTAVISDGPGEELPDPTFVKLTSSDINFHSAERQSALSHTFSGALTYSTSWCDLPLSFSLGARYEAAGEKRHTSTLESWGILYKFSASF